MVINSRKTGAWETKWRTFSKKEGLISFVQLRQIRCEKKKEGAR